MIRTGFELKTTAATLEEAISDARGLVSGFLGIPDSELDDRVTMELRVQLPKAETAAEIAKAVDDGIFVVTIYGSVKQSTVKPFGL